MTITESIKFNKLQEENEALNSKIRTLKAGNEALKNKLDEKDKEINKLLMICFHIASEEDK
ncbi:hypothetical protein C6B38_03040 [Spiroplasma sp. ChiS]|uniref:hypothetical protein n=1 Tax=Spiroplasma sp. ChiS TaxID=2099885 RepID=UPI000CF9C971|nr:hypothetical protein [Spiroplasma sp. ChiS]PQP78945.1 hypothetical protein C6B38_03040 [Spiroplasma sp. ChiS]